MAKVDTRKNALKELAEAEYEGVKRSVFCEMDGCLHKARDARDE
jgi:hypothetical protein